MIKIKCDNCGKELDNDTVKYCSFKFDEDRYDREYCKNCLKVVKQKVDEIT